MQYTYRFSAIFICVTLSFFQVRIEEGTSPCSLASVYKKKIQKDANSLNESKDFELLVTNIRIKKNKKLKDSG